MLVYILTIFAEVTSNVFRAQHVGNGLGRKLQGQGGSAPALRPAAIRGQRRLALKVRARDRHDSLRCKLE